MGAFLLAFKAWGVWSRLGGLVSRLADWAGRNPWPALAAMLVIANVVQLVIHKRDRATIAADQSTLAKVRSAEATAAQRAIAARTQQESAYQAKATQGDDNAKNLSAQSAPAADRYIAAHRVRSETIAGAAGTTLVSTPGGRAAVPEGLPTDAVVVPADDVQKCTLITDYAIAAHNWAGTINDPAASTSGATP